MTGVSSPEQLGAAELATSALVERIRRGIIGEGELMEGPFGLRRVTYADYTASGRSLDFLEDFIRDAVLPLYANTHTESSGTAAVELIAADGYRLLPQYRFDPHTGLWRHATLPPRAPLVPAAARLSRQAREHTPAGIVDRVLTQPAEPITYLG